MKRLAILGSTGSIGKNALAVAAMFPERFTVAALAARRDAARLAEQIRRFRPEAAALLDAGAREDLKARLPRDCPTELLVGPEGVSAAAAWPGVDTTLVAVVGASGLLPTLAAIDAGKTIALANKETLVMAGGIVTARATEKGVAILPVDSEHSAIFQCLQGQRREDVDRLILTASGGPFRDRPRAALETATPSEALKHPNWAMGAKITIDSATLMNKGLEVIEAAWLFGVPAERIRVVIHPQSIIHSMVAFRDGSVIAQLGVPDMKGAIAYALSHPERLPLNQPLPDFSGATALTFQEPDTERFPCLGLAFEAARRGGSFPAVLNAANEVAVDAFLAEAIGFTAIAEVVAAVLEEHVGGSAADLDGVLSADRWARRRAAEIAARFRPPGP